MVEVAGGGRAGEDDDVGVIVAEGVKISTDQFSPPKNSTKKVPVFRLFSRVFACFSRAFPKN